MGEKKEFSKERGTLLPGDPEATSWKCPEDDLDLKRTFQKGLLSQNPEAYT